MRRLGDPVIDPSVFGPAGLRHIQASGKEMLDAANNHVEYQSVLRPLSYRSPEGDVVVFSDDVAEEA